MTADKTINKAEHDRIINRYDEFVWGRKEPVLNRRQA